MPSGMPTPAPTATLRLLLGDEEAAAVASGVAVTVVVTPAEEAADVALASWARSASVPGLKARPVSPRVKLAEQQSPLEDSQQNVPVVTPAAQGTTGVNELYIAAVRGSKML
jgi:hypothetical protein